MTMMNLVQALNSALDYEMGKDEKVVILGEDVGVDGGVFRVTDGLIKKYPNRVFDTPLSEVGIVASAVGMAAMGIRPVAEIQFIGFTYLPLNQLISHAAKLRNRSRGSITVPMVLRTPYGAGVRALEHHSESTETLFAHIPGLKVVMPSTPSDAKGLLISAIRDNDTVIFLEPMRLYRAVKEEVPDGEYVVPLGKAKRVMDGKDVTLISWGANMRHATEAAENLKLQGVSCDVLDLRTVHPFDHESVMESVKKTGRCVITHEATRTLGMGAEISARIMEEAFDYLKAPVQRVTAPDVALPLAKLEDYFMPDAFAIEKAVEKVMSY